MASAAAASEEGEDPHRRRSNTDCVFFLVSRVSCTKGSKCEYRHCEGARFNPRNCWYWFHGNCVNPSCTFRHPPMENFNRTKSLSVPPSSYGSVSSKEAKPYQRSGDSTLEDTEQDESRDSSPGFDVLVDDGLSNKNNLEQQLAQKRDAQVLHAKYDFGDPVCYDQDYYDSQCYGQAFCGFDDQHGYLYLSHLEGVQDHDTETTLGHVPHNGRNLARSSSDEYGKRFFSSRNFISSAPDVVFSRQHTETRHSSKRRPEKRKGAKGRKRRTKRQRGLQPVNDSQEIESKFTHRRQDSLMEECPQSVLCATFSGQKKKLRGKQHNIVSASSSEHPTADFTGPKTLAQIKEENCVSKSSFSHCAARMPHGDPSQMISRALNLCLSFSSLRVEFPLLSPT
ncbi:hypothetical protein ACQ4PT_050999 [Festuca glaucescens]